MNYISSRTLSVLLTTLILILLPMSAAIAQIPDDAIGEILAPFQRLLGSLGFVRDLAGTIFWSLLLIEFVVSAISLFWTNGDLNAFGKYLAQRVLIIGVFALFFSNGPWIAGQVRLTFEALAQRTMLDTGAAVVVELNPGSIMQEGFELGRDMIRNTSIWDGVKAIPVMFAGFFMVLMFSLIAANMIVVLAELYLVSTLGIFVLGFFGSSWTREIAWDYWKYMISVCFKLAAMHLLVAIGLTVFQSWTAAIVGNKIDLNTTVAILGFTLVFYTLTNTIPAAAAGLIRSGANGGFGGVSGPGAQMAQAATSVAQSAAKMGGAAALTATAIGKAASNAKAGGASGASVISGAAGNLGQAMKQEAGKAVSAKINGPASGRSGSFAQNVNRNLSEKGGK